MSDEEFDEGPIDPDAPPFPEGWTEVGATTEPVELGSGRVYAIDPATGDWSELGFTTEPVEVRGPKEWATDILRTMSTEAAANVTISDADAYRFRKPDRSLIQEAIDRASADRTPLLDLPVPKAARSWSKLVQGIASHAQSLTETMAATKEALEGFSGLVTPDTGDRTHAEWKHEMLERIYGPLEHHRRQVALVGTGKRRHRAPRGTRHELGLSRAEHARRRQLYSERLRRDRRRRRAGRAPILRSSQFEMLIPRAQINVTEAGPEYMGMEIVASPLVPDDQVYVVVDPSILDGYRFTEPKTFDWSDAERRAARHRDQVSLYGYGMRPTGRFRTTNYFTQMMNAYAAERPWFQGHSADQFWVDETTDWAPEHTADVDRWINEGGADRG